jgi:phospholipid/cholesterol/gamma-HCH transport system substrate-binding protein
MNERVMQFRIGMFVIVAGLVLTMLIVWFGESPLLLRDHGFVTVHYLEAPGVAEGTPVRKSGIRIGKVSAISFDTRPNQPDGVLVTLSLDTRYKIRTGSVPRLTRSLIGDVTIDMLPGTGPGLLPISESAGRAPVIEGAVAADPSKALEAATDAFEKAGDTLNAINKAATGFAELTKNAANVDEFLTTWNSTGKDLAAAAKRIDQLVASNQDDFQPTLQNVREVSQKFNATLDPKTQDMLKTGISRFAMASARLDSGLADAAPFFKDVGMSTNGVPSTDFGQTMRRLNRISNDLNLLTNTLNNGKGGLNPDGSLQRVLMRTELSDNLNRMTNTVSDTFAGFRPVIAAFRIFAEKVARDPGAISRGALQRQ